MYSKYISTTPKSNFPFHQIDGLGLLSVVKWNATQPDQNKSTGQPEA